MSLFGNLTNEGLEEAQDRLGGFRRLESDAYLGKIKMAYAGQSSGGARSITLIFGHGEGAKEEYRETIYITNREGKNYYVDDKKKKQPLPGFTTIDDICQMITGKPLAEQATEEKVVNVYDADAKKELPKSVPVLTELLDGDVILGIIKQTVTKQVKQGDTYVDSDETREENVIEKVFHHPSQLTVAEAKKGVQSAAFYGAWVETNKGKTRDKTKKAAGGIKTGRPGMPPTAGATGNGAAKGASLFAR